MLRDLVRRVESREMLVDREPSDAFAIGRGARPPAGGWRRATVREYHRVSVQNVLLVVGCVQSDSAN